MTIIQLIVLIGAAMIISGIAGAILSGFKNRDISFWVALTFLFPPSLLVLILLPRHRGRRPRRPSLDEEDTMMDQI